MRTLEKIAKEIIPIFQLNFLESTISPYVFDKLE